MSEDIIPEAMEVGQTLSTQIIERQDEITTDLTDQKIQKLELYVEELKRQMEAAYSNTFTPRNNQTKTQFFNTPHSTSTL